MTDEGTTDSKVYTNDGMDLWDIYDRQAAQSLVNYNTLGATADRACANCQWYVAPSGCVVVKSSPEPIVPTGLSDLYKERVLVDPQMVPIPVVIVDLPESQSSITEDEPQEQTQVTITVPKSLKATLLARVTNMIEIIRGTKSDPIDPVDIGEPQPFMTFKDLKGQWRWFAFTSNKFRDRDNPPEIFEDSAHKDYVKYLDEGGDYPELWLWHEPGSRFGQADWVDYADGFLMHGGTIDPGSEDVAKAISNQKGWGVSHGYHFLHSDEKNGIIGWYRTFEVSLLPSEAAANPWTSIEMLQKELGNMAFNREKRIKLVEQFGEEIVVKFDGNLKGLAEELDRRGIEYKELDLANDATPGQIDYKALGEEAAKAMAELPAFKTLTDGVASIATDVEAVKSRLDALEKSDDEKIAAAIMPKVKAGIANGAYKASGEQDNTIDKDDESAKQGPANDWFGAVVEQIAGAPANP